MADATLGWLIKCSFCSYVFSSRFPRPRPGLYMVGNVEYCPECGEKMPAEAADALPIPEGGVRPGIDATYSFVESVNVQCKYGRLNPEQHHEAIRPAIVSFVRNMERANSMVHFLFYAIGRATVRQHIIDKAFIENRTKLDVQNELLSQCNMAQRLFFLGRKGADLAVAEVASREVGNHAVESLLASQTVGAWTAFEALAKDLWVRCLNARLHLGLVALDAEVLATDSEDEAEIKKKKKITIPAGFLNQPGFDPAQRMGDILKQMRKWDFANRNTAHEAYRAVFGVAAQNVLRSIFETDLKCLADLRNNLVHNGGIADEDFESRMKNHPHFSKVKTGTPIHLDGAIVSAMVNSVDEKGCELIAFIDSQLK